MNESRYVCVTSVRSVQCGERDELVTLAIILIPPVTTKWLQLHTSFTSSLHSTRRRTYYYCLAVSLVCYKGQRDIRIHCLSFIYLLFLIFWFTKLQCMWIFSIFTQLKEYWLVCCILNVLYRSKGHNILSFYFVFFWGYYEIAMYVKFLRFQLI